MSMGSKNNKKNYKFSVKAEDIILIFSVFS